MPVAPSPHTVATVVLVKIVTWKASQASREGVPPAIGDGDVAFVPFAHGIAGFARKPPEKLKRS